MKKVLQSAISQFQENDLLDFSKTEKLLNLHKDLYEKVKSEFFKTCPICYEISSYNSYCNCKIKCDTLCPGCEEISIIDTWTDCKDNGFNRTDLIRFIEVYENAEKKLKEDELLNKSNNKEFKIIEILVNRVFKIIINISVSDEDKNYYNELVNCSDFSTMENYKYSNKAQDFDDSIIILEELFVLCGSSNQVVKFLKGFCEMKLFLSSQYRDEDGAIEAFKYLIDSKKNNWYLSYLLGMIFMNKRGTWDLSALDYFNYCIKENEIFPDAYYYRAQINKHYFGTEIGIDDANLIFKDYEKCIQLNPYFDSAYDGLGVAIIRFDRYSDKKINILNALENYNKAIFINNNNDYAYFKRSFLFFELNDFTNAMFDIEKALKLSTCQLYFSLRAEINVKLNNLVLALKDYDSACYLNSNSYEYWKERGEVITLLKERGEFNNNLIVEFEKWKEIMGI